MSIGLLGVLVVLYALVLHTLLGFPACLFTIATTPFKDNNLISLQAIDALVCLLQSIDWIHLLPVIDHASTLQISLPTKHQGHQNNKLLFMAHFVHSNNFLIISYYSLLPHYCQIPPFNDLSSIQMIFLALYFQVSAFSFY